VQLAEPLGAQIDVFSIRRATRSVRASCGATKPSRRSRHPGRRRVRGGATHTRHAQRDRRRRDRRGTLIEVENAANRRRQDDQDPRYRRRRGSYILAGARDAHRKPPRHRRRAGAREARRGGAGASPSSPPPSRPPSLRELAEEAGEGPGRPHFDRVLDVEEVERKGCQAEDDRPKAAGRAGVTARWAGAKKPADGRGRRRAPGEVALRGPDNGFRERKLSGDRGGREFVRPAGPRRPDPVPSGGERRRGRRPSLRVRKPDTANAGRRRRGGPRGAATLRPTPRPRPRSSLHRSWADAELEDDEGGSRGSGRPCAVLGENASASAAAAAAAVAGGALGSGRRPGRCSGIDSAAASAGPRSPTVISSG